MVIITHGFFTNLDPATAVVMLVFGLLIFVAAMLVKQEIVFDNAFVVSGFLVGATTMLMGITGLMMYFLHQFL